MIESYSFFDPWSLLAFSSAGNNWEKFKNVISLLDYRYEASFRFQFWVRFCGPLLKSIAVFLNTAMGNILKRLESSRQATLATL